MFLYKLLLDDVGDLLEGVSAVVECSEVAESVNGSRQCADTVLPQKYPPTLLIFSHSTPMKPAYHFTADKLRDGSPIPKKGEWLEYEGKVVICQSGLHFSRHPFDALQYAPGNLLHLVEVEDVVEEWGDKGVARKRKIIATIDAGPLLREFARKCALDVVNLWDAPDVVVRYLKTGDESIREAARDAARDAAYTAATSAVWYTTRDAARDAARYAADAVDAADAAAIAAGDAFQAARRNQRPRLARMVNKAFKEQMQCQD